MLLFVLHSVGRCSGWNWFLLAGKGIGGVFKVWAASGLKTGGKSPFREEGRWRASLRVFPFWTIGVVWGSVGAVLSDTSWMIHSRYCMHSCEKTRNSWINVMPCIAKKKAGSDTQPGKDSLAEVCASPTLESEHHWPKYFSSCVTSCVCAWSKAALCYCEAGGDFL